jgi:hypothetical protein
VTAPVVIDTDTGTILGRWICENPECGRVTVVRTRSRWAVPPKDPSERCSCSGCCFSIRDRAGTVKWVPEPSNVIPFPKVTP